MTTRTFTQQAQMEVMSAVQNLSTLEELKEFKDSIALFFAEKAQKAIEALWDQGVINEDSIEAWGKEHMRTPYSYAENSPRH